MATSTGPELRKERRDADVFASDLARAAGWSRAWVHIIEKSAVVTHSDLERYRKALSECVEAREAQA